MQSVINKYKEFEQKRSEQHGEKQNHENVREKELLDTGIKWFYWIKAPGIGIKPPTEYDYKTFIQSTSQGSRCLKSKTLLLYKVQK